MGRLEQTVRRLMAEQNIGGYEELAARANDAPGVVLRTDATTLARAVEEPTRMRPQLWSALRRALGEEHRSSLWEAFQADLEAAASSAMR